MALHGNKKLIAILLACFAVIGGLEGAPASAQSVSSKMTATKMVELPRLSAARLSPDGTRLVYLRRTTDWKADRHINNYRMLNLETGEDIQILTPEAEGEDYKPVVWAEDSQSFLLLLERDGAAGVADQQAWQYLIATEELRQITRHGKPVLDAKWGADGKIIYFRAEDPLASSSVDENISRRELSEAIRPFDKPRNRHLWSINVDSLETRQITQDDYTVDSYVELPDGGFIISRTPSRRHDDRINRELYLIAGDGNAPIQLTKNRYSESKLSLCPDGKKLSYIATVNEKGEPYYEDNLFILDLVSGQTTLMGKSLPMEILDAEWHADGNSLYFVANIGLTSQLFSYEVETKNFMPLTEGEHELHSWSYQSAVDQHLFQLENANNPGEIYLSADGSIPKQLTTVFTNFGASPPLGRQVAYNWRGNDGQELEGLLVFPVNYKEGKSFPLVTITHGGPRASSQFGSWNVSRSIPVFSTEGYGVFLPNHRGGTGYGDEFMRDMVGLYFRNADHDVMSGIDSLIKDGLVDKQRLIKHGWSAGGHMTNWLITQTDRFVAASSGAGASDWVSHFAESDVRYMRRFHFDTLPWERGVNLKKYRRQSPLFSAHKVTTPTLFWAGEKDERVPPTQSIMMYRALEAAGAPTELYIAKGEKHNFSKPSHQLFKINTEMAWYAKYTSGTYVASYPEHENATGK